MVEEARVGSAEEACLKHLRGSRRLQSETLRTVIHIFSRCYEDPKASKILSQEPTGRGGDSNSCFIAGDSRQGEKCVRGEIGDPAALKIDDLEDLTHELKDSKLEDCPQMEFSVGDIENMIMDIDGIEEAGQADVFYEDSSQKVQNDLSETASFGQHLAESLQHEDELSNFVEFDYSKDEAAQCGNGDDKCCPSENDVMVRNQQLDSPNNMLESASGQMDVQRKNGSDGIEEGEIDNVNAHVRSHISQDNSIETLQQSESVANQPNSVEQSKPCEELSRPEFVPVKTMDVPISTSAAEINEKLITVAKDGLECPTMGRKPVSYGDISEETLLNAQGTLKTDFDLTERKRGGNSKEKKKLQKRKKRAEMDKKLGVKRMKLPPALKPKVIKVCEHYLKGRCRKGGECTFSHDVTPLTKSKPCIHFARKSCMKGDACPYDHELWKYPCVNFASQGFCNRGSSCSFSHEIPAKEGSQGVSSAEKLSLKSPSPPGNSSINPVSSAAKIAMKPPLQVPKGLNFISFENSGSNKLKPSSSPQKVNLIGQVGHTSSHCAPGMAKTMCMSSKPLAMPVTGNNSPFREVQLDHPITNKNSIPKAGGSKMMVDSTSTLDRALLGLSSLVPSKAPLNRFSNECLVPPPKELIPPGHHVSGLGMHKQSGSSVGKEKSGLKLDDKKGQDLKSKSQVVDNIRVETTQAKLPTGVHLFSSDKSPMIKPNEKLNTSVSKDQENSIKVPIHDPVKQSISGNPHNSRAEVVKASVSIPSSSSQGLAANKNMPSSVQQSLFSTLAFASKFESETKGYSLGSAGNSRSQKEPENSTASSSSKNSFNCQPVKASAILNFIFGTGGQNRK
ncbi:unnamed protein product [Rhodiola kirilowii]